MRRFIKYLLIYSCIILLSNNAICQQQVEPAALKSAWLAHFSKFIEWPNINDTTESFVIAVIGNDDFNGYLEKIYSQRRIKDREVVIKYLKSTDDINHCHILFIAKNMRKDLDDILKIVNSKPILTVGDESGFAEKGVMINFYTEGNKMGFEVNISTSQYSELDMSFRLLELAKIVRNN